MPNLTGLAAFVKRAQVLATSALSYLTTISAVLVVLAQQLDSIAGAPEWLTKLVAQAVIVVTAITLQVRRVTPVDDSQKGLLPPKGPAVAVEDVPVDRGQIGLNTLFAVVALVLFLVVGAIGAGWVTSEYVFAFLGFGLAAWVLAELVP